MATALLGDSTWSRMPGGSESSGEDGKVTITRMYNGAITGGSGGTGETSWLAFRAAHPPGTADPVYGSAALSTAYPSISEARNATYTASITFSGGTYEPGKDHTKPQVTKELVARELFVSHPDNAEKKVGLNYAAWQSTISYTQSSEPPKVGQFRHLADNTAAITTTPPILQDRPDDVDDMTSDEIDTATTSPEFPWLESITMTKRSESGGTEIWDCVEVWLKGLEVA